ncbi:MAG: hypothetical protein RBU37_26005 [Myxococcota bacterium]|jgi:hypothetical protein|nr:hypothetical protein [Myxococcota bacterium]
MSAINRVSAELSSETEESILVELAHLRKSMPFLLSLSSEDRIELLKMSSKSVGFVQSCAELVKRQPEILPGTFDKEEFLRDAELYQRLSRILPVLAQLCADLEDTQRVVGSEAYAAALHVYRYAKLSNAEGQLEASIDELGKRFARRASKPSEG